MHGLRSQAVFHPTEAVQWLQMQLNRPSRKPLDEAAFWSSFELNGQPLSAAPAVLAQAGETELLAIVTTYQRPDSCTRVVEALARALEHSGVTTARVLIFHDRAPASELDADRPV